MRKFLPILKVLLLSAIFLAGLLVRCYYFRRACVTASFLTGDALNRYLPLARNISGRGEFSVVPGVPDTFNQPIYPLALVPFLGHLRVVVALQMCLELALIPVVWRITRILGGSPTVAVCMLWACPTVPHLSALLCTEPLATLFVALLLWALVRGNWLWSGVLGGLCILTRGDLIVAVPLMFVAALLAHRPTLRAVAPGVICLFGILLPWSIRTYRVAGTFNFVTGVSDQTREPYIQWMNLWADNEFCIEQYWWVRPAAFPEQLIPETAEREQALQAAAGAPRPRILSAEANAVFVRLAAQRRRAYPAHSLVVRVQRPFVCWASVVPGSRKFVPLSAGGILLLALSVFVLLRPTGPILIAGALLLARSLLPWLNILGTESRFLVEALPAAFTLSSVALYQLCKSRSNSVYTSVSVSEERGEGPNAELARRF